MTCSKKIRPATGASSIWVRENPAADRAADYRYAISILQADERMWQAGQPFTQQRVDVLGTEPVADGLHSGGIVDGGEPVSNAVNPIPFLAA
jgi:hypothetical protein